jgi:hypothetical protein
MGPCNESVRHLEHRRARPEDELDGRSGSAIRTAEASLRWASEGEAGRARKP